MSGTLSPGRARRLATPSPARPLRNRRQLEALVASLIDLLDATEDTDADMCVEDENRRLMYSVRPGSSSCDDTEPSDGYDVGGSYAPPAAGHCAPSFWGGKV